MTDTTAPTYPHVAIPYGVRDNSETVVDYAYMRHISPHDWTRTLDYRDSSLMWSWRHDYTTYSWDDTNQRTGQRCHFDMLVNQNGTVVHLFHTEYFTRVACSTGGFCYSYASHYALVVKDGVPTTDGPLPYCDEHLHRIERESALSVHKSERLLIGQHD